MRAGIVVTVTPTDRRRLEAIVRDRGAPQKHVWRANIILATADGCGTAEIMRRSGKSKPVVWRWQARFMTEGIAGLTRDKTRKPGKQPLSAATVRRGVDLALGPPPQRDDPLDRSHAGRGGGGEPAVGAAHPGSPPTCTAPHPHLQGHRRSLCRSAGPRGRPLR